MHQGSTRDRVRQHALAVALALALAGCGGGGGGGNTLVRPEAPPPAPPPADPVVFDPNPEFSKHLELTGASAAHEAGLSGQGIRIGVIDSGVNRNHPALSPRVVDNLVYLDPDRNDLSVDDVVGHGTAVSQIMAGTPFGEWPGGIAPGAEIVSARIISDEPPEDDGSGKGNEIDGAVGLAPVHQDLIERGVRIMNNSWGGLYWTNPEATAPIAQEYRPFVIDHGGLVVFSTGNSSFADPSSMAALPSQQGPDGTFPAADLEVGWLAVAALETGTYLLASYSNACGVAMDYCLVAPGNVVVTGTDDAPDHPSYWGWSGTSFSAPIVSGAAALVWEAFPYFDNDMVRQTLLGTAQDLGALGVDPVFGHGLVRIDTAIQGPGSFDWGDVIADFDGITSTWSNRIDGEGGLVKRGSGRLELTNLNDFRGETRIEDGTLAVGGRLSEGPTVVGPQGNLELFMHEFSSGIVLAGGLWGDLENLGTVTLLGPDRHWVSGNYTQSAEGRLALEVGSVLHVGGSAAVAGEAHVLGVADGYVTSDREDVLIAEAGLTGTFDRLTAAQGVLLEATLGYDATSAWLEIERLDVGAAAQAMNLSSTAIASARRVEGAFRVIDDGAEGGVDGFLDGAGALQRTPTARAAERSLASLSGELHQAGAALALMAIDGNRHALESRLDRRSAVAAADTWADRLDSQRPGSHMAFDANGWVIGLDRRVGGNVVVGMAFGESQGYGWHALRGDRERSRQVEGQLYGAWSFGDSYLLGRLAHGRSERDVHRQILLGRDAFGVDSDYAYRYGSAGLQFGHRLHWDDTVLTPYVGAQVLHLQRDGFVEYGAAGFGLSAADSSVTAGQALAGLRFDRGFRLGGERWNWHGRVERQQPLEAGGAAIDARFTGIDVWSPIGGRADGDALLRPATVFGFGLDTHLRHGSRLSFGLDGRHQDGRTDTAAHARWSIAF